MRALLCQRSAGLPPTDAAAGMAAAGRLASPRLPPSLLFLPGEAAARASASPTPRAFARRVSSLLLRARCAPPPPVVTLAKVEFSGWQHLFCFGFVLNFFFLIMGDIYIFVS